MSLNFVRRLIERRRTRGGSLAQINRKGHAIAQPIRISGRRLTTVEQSE
jgi:hypothetical protein